MNIREALLLAGCGFIFGCAQQPSCEHLEKIGQSGEVREYLEKWVDERARSGDFLLSEDNLGRVTHPGEYTIDIPLSKNIESMRSFEARAIMSGERELISVFFGQDSYRGLIVKTPSQESFGVAPGNLKKMSGRVALICIDHSIF